MISFREAETSPKRISEEADHSDQKLEEKPPRPLRCRSCGNVVSDARYVFGPGGLPARQVFANPGGRVFELLTVRAASSVEAWGEPTTEHTWFSGYAWSALVCARCSTHLGWRFDAVTGAEPPYFFGFITSEIVEAE